MSRQTSMGELPDGRSYPRWFSATQRSDGVPAPVRSRPDACHRRLVAWHERYARLYHSLCARYRSKPSSAFRGTRADTNLGTRRQAASRDRELQTPHLLGTEDHLSRYAFQCADSCRRRRICHHLRRAGGGTRGFHQGSAVRHQLGGEEERP